MNKETEALVKDLERRFNLIAKMEIQGSDNALFYSAINGYMEVTKRAIHISPKFHTFDHAEHDKFEEEVCQKIKHDESIPETERDWRVSSMFEYYYAPMYDTLEDVGKRIREQQGKGYIQFAYSMSAWKYREYLEQIHPTIIAVLEEELARDVLIKEPEQKISAFVSGIFYNPITGIGWANGKKFKFKDQKPNFILFGKLYARIGNRVTKEEIWDIIRHEGNMIAINDVAGELREKTGLNVDELVLNNGNLTLALKKLESPPPTP